jgi:hypothetical protein
MQATTRRQRDCAKRRSPSSATFSQQCGKQRCYGLTLWRPYIPSTDKASRATAMDFVEVDKPYRVSHKQWLELGLGAYCGIRQRRDGLSRAGSSWKEDVGGTELLPLINCDADTIRCVPGPGSVKSAASCGLRTHPHSDGPAVDGQDSRGGVQPAFLRDLAVMFVKRNRPQTTTMRGSAGTFRCGG